MTTLRQAAKKALEALIWCEPSWAENPKGFKRWSDAMPVLREAIERPKWVGLTDEEVDKIIDAEIGFNSCWGPEEDFARAIESKLKEKNT